MTTLGADPVRSRCPDCDRDIATEPGFPAWCQHCEWNLDPSPPPEAGRMARWAGRRLARRSVRIYQRLVKGSAFRSPGLMLAIAAGSLAVHLLTVALAAVGVLLIVPGFGLAAVIRYPLGLCILAIAAYVQPFRYHRRRRVSYFQRTDLPALFGLADKVADALYTGRVERLLLTERFNASWRKPPLRAASIEIGMALWSVLDPQEWVSLLGHELGHGVNGDSRRRLPVALAIRTLGNWHAVLYPGAQVRLRRGRSPMSADGLATLLLPVVLAPLALLTQAMSWVLLVMTTRQGLASEYYADELGARAGGTAASVSGLEKLLRGPACQQEIRQVIRYRREEDPWVAVAECSRGFPEHEQERLRRLGRIRLPAIDNSHPPTQLRADLIRNRPPHPPKVTVTPAEAAAIEAELAPFKAALARRLRSDAGIL